jgi:PadR family transcriptional regulator, regulatory protein PadR
MLKVLSILLDHPGAPHYGLDLSRRAELATGTIYPILTRLEQAGWIRSNWEETAPSQLGRPRRRLYLLTDEGTEQATRALEEGRQAILPDRTAQRGGLYRPGPWGSPA